VPTAARERDLDDPLARGFYERPTVLVARALLGCRLARLEPDERRVARIVETEAYVANDPASHAYRGKTERNRSMFERPGTLYVYRIHQVHCANVVTRPGEAVLLRGAEPVSAGLGPTHGPGRLCRAFSLTVQEDGTDLTQGPICILPRDRPLSSPIVVGPRVGISRAVELPLRFALAESRHVSSPRPGPRARRTRPSR
jgi:DNA-3-methyladenine glycosylase